MDERSPEAAAPQEMTPKAPLPVLLIILIPARCRGAKKP